MYKRIASFGICITVYVFALLCAAILINRLQHSLNDLLLSFLADVLATVIVFAASVVFKNASLYDPYWSVAPPIMVYYWLWRWPGLEGTVTAAVITLWAIRLTANWARGWSGLNHEDWRYVMLRKKNPSLYWLTNFAGIHLFPTVMVFMGMVPVYYITKLSSITPGRGVPTNHIVFILGCLVCVIATVIELVADEQMRTFKKTAAKGSFINQGLWKYSRHPNYFGEILFWIGLWIVLMGVAPQYWHTGLGALAMAAMFIFASIPMMEQKNLANKPGYKNYINQVSMLIPWWPSR